MAMATKTDRPKREFFKEWNEAAPKINSETMVKVYKAYLEHVVGLVDPASQAALGDMYNKIFGKMLRGMGAGGAESVKIDGPRLRKEVDAELGRNFNERGDYRGFWNAVAPLLPMKYDQGEMAYLTTEGRNTVAWLIIALNAHANSAISLPVFVHAGTSGANLTGE